MGRTRRRIAMFVAIPRFPGRRAVVTGASSGIGRATALRLAREGARVALIARGQAGLDAVAAEIGDKDGVLVLPADCTDEGSIRTAIDAAATAFGGLDILISNAGIELLGQDDRV